MEIKFVSHLVCRKKIVPFPGRSSSVIHGEESYEKLSDLPEFPMRRNPIQTIPTTVDRLRHSQKRSDFG